MTDETLWDAFTEKHCRQFADDYFWDEWEELTEDFIEYAKRAVEDGSMPLDGSWRTLANLYIRELGEFPAKPIICDGLLDEIRQAERELR